MGFFSAKLKNSVQNLKLSEADSEVIKQADNINDQKDSDKDKKETVNATEEKSTLKLKKIVRTRKDFDEVVGKNLILRV